MISQTSEELESNRATDTPRSKFLLSFQKKEEMKDIIPEGYNSKDSKDNQKSPLLDWMERSRSIIRIRSIEPSC